MRDEFDSFTVDLAGAGGSPAVQNFILLENGNQIGLEDGSGSLLLEA